MRVCAVCARYSIQLCTACGLGLAAQGGHVLIQLWRMSGLQIYLRIPLQPREDLAGWRSVLQNIMESSAAATRMVLVTLSCPSELRGRYVLLEETIIMGPVSYD